MTSPKVLIDAQCLLIKKLLLLTTTVVHAKTRCSLKTALELGKGIKKNNNIKQGRCSISMEDGEKK